MWASHLCLKRMEAVLRAACELSSMSFGAIHCMCMYIHTAIETDFPKTQARMCTCNANIHMRAFTQKHAHMCEHLSNTHTHTNAHTHTHMHTHTHTHTYTCTHTHSQKCTSPYLTSALTRRLVCQLLQFLARASVRPALQQRMMGWSAPFERAPS